MDFLDGRTIRDLWTERTTVSGGDTFLEFRSTEGDERAYTYGEFDQQIDRIASSLADRLGVAKGEKVAIHLPNCPEYLLVWFALLKLGAIAVHSNTDHSAREVTYTVRNSDSRILITSPDYRDLLREVCAKSGLEHDIYARTGGEPEFDGSPTLSGLTNTADPTLPPVRLEPEDAAQIIFTSGTTSDPKGVVHSHANLLYSGERASKHISMRDTDRMLTALPVFHVNAQSLSTLSAITVGATVVLLEDFEASTYVEQLQRYDATLTSLVGTQVRALLATPESASDPDNAIREIFFAINVSDAEKSEFESRFDVSLLNGYGLSETMTIVSMAPNHGDRAWPAIGRPAIDREVALLDDDGEPVPLGEMGEIAVGGTRGRNLMKEYYKDPEKTDETFTDGGYLLTGDYGRFDDSGNLYFVDRKKNIIQTRGENVSEAEVESVLESHPSVEEAAVIGVSHDIYGEAVKALVTVTDDTVSVEALEEHCRERLAAFKVPQEFGFVSEFPRTSIGKIEKSALRDSRG